MDGWLRYRWLFTLRDYESFSFEQQVELREADLKKIIDHLKENVSPNFDPARTEIRIAYESKMNNYDQNKMPNDRSDDLHSGQSREGDSQRDGFVLIGGLV